MLIPLVFVSCAGVEESAKVSLVIPRSMSAELLKSASSRAAATSTGTEETTEESDDLTIECTVSGSGIKEVQTQKVTKDADILFSFDDIPAESKITVEAVIYNTDDEAKTALWKGTPQETVLKSGENRILLTLTKVKGSGEGGIVGLETFVLTATFADSSESDSSKLEDGGTVEISDAQSHITFLATVEIQPANIFSVEYSWSVNDKTVPNAKEVSYTLDCSSGNVLWGNNTVSCTINIKNEDGDSVYGPESRTFNFILKEVTPIILYSNYQKNIDYTEEKIYRLGYITSKEGSDYAVIPPENDSFVDFYIGANNSLFVLKDTRDVSGAAAYSLSQRAWIGSEFGDETIISIDSRDYVFDEIEIDSADDTAIYAKSSDGNILKYVTDADSGTTSWYDVLTANDANGNNIQTFCVHDNTIYAVCTDYVEGEARLFILKKNLAESQSSVKNAAALSALGNISITDSLEYPDLYYSEDTAQLYLLVRDVSTYVGPGDNKTLRSQGAVCKIDADTFQVSSIIGYADHTIAAADLQKGVSFSYQHNANFYGPTKIIAIKEKEQKLLVADDGFAIDNAELDGTNNNTYTGDALSNVNRIVTVDLSKGEIEKVVNVAEAADYGTDEIEFDNYYTSFSYSNIQ